MHSQESEILILLSDLFEYAILLLPLYVSLSLGIYKLSTKKGLPFPMLSWIPGVQLYNLFAFIGKIRESLFLITSICGIGFIVFLASSNSPIDLGLLRLIILPIGLLIPLFLFRLITINIQSLLQKVGHSGVFWWCMLILFLPFTLLYFWYKYEPTLEIKEDTPTPTIRKFFLQMTVFGGALLTGGFLVLWICIALLALCIITWPVWCPISGFWK